MSPDDLPMADIPADTPMMSEEMLLLTVAQNPYIPAHKIPYPKQLQFLGLECRNALYGGAAGGGKSESLLMAALQFVHLVPNYSALIVRRSLSDLKLPGGLMDRALEWLRPHLKVRGGSNLRGGGGKKGTVVWNGADYKFTFPNGATLQFGYCDNDGDENRYHGAEFQFCGLDEAVQFSEKQIIFFGSERIRKKADMAVPERYRLATTPGGPGHEFLRRWFIDPGTPGDVFIPANAWDNPGVDAESYIRGLQLLKTSDPLRYKQMVDGDWDSVQGETFKREWFGSWRIDRSLKDTMVLYAHRGGEVERFRFEECGRFQTCDPAISTSSKADKFVLSTWLITPRANLVWWGCLRGHFDFPTQLAVCRSEYRKYRPQFLAVENVAYQKALIDQLRTCRDPVMAVKEVAPGGKDKLARSVPAVAMAQAGRVFVPAEATADFAVDEVLSEVASFTGEPKRKDDAVDTFTYACMLLPFVRPGHAGYGTPAPFRHVGKLDFIAS